MEIYLNIAEWAPGVYGIEAAAQHHFGVSAANLNASQSALLPYLCPIPTSAMPVLRRWIAAAGRQHRRRAPGNPRLHHLSLWIDDAI